MKKLLCAWIAILLMAMPVFAENVWNEALTPLGADKSGNTDGSIPAWDGGITSPPAAYTKGGFHPDPFGDDKILFTITSDNWTNYKDKLTLGHQAMFAKYADYKMPVYQTRRSASYPQHVYDAIIKNADTATLIEDGNGIERPAALAVPFPVPENGLEAIWNHLLRYRGESINRLVNHTAVLSADQLVNTLEEEKILFPLAVPGTSFDASENILAYFKQDLLAPHP